MICMRGHRFMPLLLVFVMKCYVLNALLPDNTKCQTEDRQAGGQCFQLKNMNFRQAVEKGGPTRRPTQQDRPVVCTTWWAAEMAGQWATEKGRPVGYRKRHSGGLHINPGPFCSPPAHPSETHRLSLFCSPLAHPVVQSAGLPKIHVFQLEKWPSGLQAFHLLYCFCKHFCHHVCPAYSVFA